MYPELEAGSAARATLKGTPVFVPCSVRSQDGALCILADTTCPPFLASSQVTGPRGLALSPPNTWGECVPKCPVSSVSSSVKHGSQVDLFFLQDDSGLNDEAIKLQP